MQQNTEVRQECQGVRFPFIPNPTKTYKVAPAANNEVALDVNMYVPHNSNIILWTYLGQINQRWKIELDVIGNYTLISIHQNRVMEAVSTENGVFAQGVVGRTDELNQRWRIFNVNDVRNDLFQIREGDKGLALSVIGTVGKTSAVGLAPYIGNNNDIWQITEA